jgi:hypothetical protein
MNYVVAVLANQTQAEEAFSTLKREGLPAEQIQLVGDGYQPASALTFLDPSIQSRQSARFMSFWLVPFGFIAGYAFNLSTQFQLFPWAGTLGNQIIGGIFGAIAGSIGSIVMGSSLWLPSDSPNTVPYRKRLKAGKYVLIVSGAPNLTNKATRILRQLKPENIQGYVAPR